MHTIETPVYIEKVLAFMVDHLPDCNHNENARAEALAHPDTTKIALMIGQNMDTHIHPGTALVRIFSTDLSNRYHAQFVSDQPAAAQSFYGLIDPVQLKQYQDVEVIAMRYHKPRGRRAVVAIEFQGGGVIEVQDKPLDDDLYTFIERTMGDVPSTHSSASNFCAYHLRDAMQFVQIADTDSNRVQYCTMFDGCHFFQTISKGEFGLSILATYVHP